MVFICEGSGDLMHGRHERAPACRREVSRYFRGSHSGRATFEDLERPGAKLCFTSFLTSVVVVVLLLDDGAFSFRCLAFRLGRREVVQKGGLADASVGVENDAFVF